MFKKVGDLFNERHSLLEKLRGELVQIFGALSSGIV